MRPLLRDLVHRGRDTGRLLAAGAPARAAGAAARPDVAQAGTLRHGVVALSQADGVADGPGLARAYWLAWLATVVFFGGFYALLVPLPRYLVAIGLPDWQVGLVLGTFGVASLVGRPVAGLASDRLGARPIMLAGAGSLAFGALAVSVTSNVGLLVGLRIFQALGYVAFTTAGTALVVQLTHPAERARRLAIFGAAANIAIALVPAAVAVLLSVAPLEAGLLASAGLAGLGGLLALRLPPRPATAPVARPDLPAAQPSLPEARPDPPEARPDPPMARPGPPVALAAPALAVRLDRGGRVGRDAMIPRRLWRPMVATGLLGGGFAAFFQFAPILAERCAVPAGLLYTTYGAAIIATRLLGGRLLDRWPVGRVVVLGAVLMALGHALIAATSVGLGDSATGGLGLSGGGAGGLGLGLLLVAAALVAISGGLFHPALIAHHAALLPGAAGRASAAFYVAFDLGIGLGSWLLGVALQVAGLPGLYWTAAALAVAVVPLGSRLGRANAPDRPVGAASPPAMRRDQHVHV